MPKLRLGKARGDLRHCTLPGPGQDSVSSALSPGTRKRELKGQSMDFIEGNLLDLKIKIAIGLNNE